MMTALHGQNYWFGFLTSTGDTLNRKDSLGYWQGLHVSMHPWECNKLFDTCDFVMGYYEHGQPIGKWIDYKGDGTFSLGQYNSGIEVTSDGKGGWTEKHQGIYAKIGVWEFFDKDSNLLKTERYDRSFSHKVWTDKTFLKDSTGNFVLTKYEFLNQRDLNSPFKVMITNNYYDNGMPAAFSKKNFWKHITTTFYPSGEIQHTFKCRKVLGFKINRSISKSYATDGKVIKKEIGKCWIEISHTAW